MRVLSKVLVAVCVVALAVASASAQEPKQRGQRGQGQPGRGGFGMGMGGGGMAGLLMNTGVQEELKITDDQKTTLRDKQQEAREKAGDLREKFQSASPEERQELMKKMGTEQTHLIKGVLKPEQFTRLQQIYWQNNTLAALTTDEELQKKLNVTAEQKEKLKTINEEMRKEMGELRQEAQGNFQQIMPKMQALTKESNTKAAETLNADQKKQWHEMVGKPFEVKFEAPRRRDT
jgi:Spy/CpxP family protein refolding chaperone